MESAILTSTVPPGNGSAVTKRDPTPEPAAGPVPWRPTASGLRLDVQARPGRPRTRPTGMKPLADGGVALAVDVAAPPEDGKANDELVATLARLFGLQRSSVRIAVGAGARRKSLTIDGDPAELAATLAGWVRGEK